ncbi:hypothetical protein BTS2_1333 [Bacillus sp. TS-2]|nr:hypothetical protein BTS2_1333 [Bacillus sp. TS-2]
MKKLAILLMVVVFLFIGGVVVLATVDFNRLGKDNVYVQVTEPTNVEETVLESGEVMQRFWYETFAYDESGERVEVEFSAAKELRENAYLMLYVKNQNEVTSYDEVMWEVIPEAAQNELTEDE